MTEPEAIHPDRREDLADRVAQLLERVERLERENAGLRAARHPDPPVTGAVSRRAMLRRAGSAAVVGVGAVAGLALGAPPALAGDRPFILGGFNDAGASFTKVTSTHGEATFIAENEDVGSGLYAGSVQGTGLEAYSGSGTAIVATADGAQKASVYGRKTTTGNAVIGEIDAPASHWGAVAGITNGHGPAIIGENHGDGYGAQGRGLGSGDGVFGESTLGRGGRFKGKKAQLKLEPSSAVSHPTSGQAGDLFVDAGHRLWFCKGATAWKQLA